MTRQRLWSALASPWTARLFLVVLLYIMPHTAFAQNNSDNQQPNILIVIADDLHWSDMGCMGNEQVRTPNIDRLAKEGKAFDAAFTSTAMCAPTRQQLLTGLWPVRSGAWPNHSGVYKGVRSLPHHLQDLGYRTAHMGKGHIKPGSSYPFEKLGDVPSKKGLPEQLPDLSRRVTTFFKEAGNIRQSAEVKYDADLDEFYIDYPRLRDMKGASKFDVEALCSILGY